MICHELRKLFCRRVIIVLLLLLFVINGAVVWNLNIPGIEPYANMDATHIRSLYRALPEDGTVALSALEGKKEELTQALWDEKDPGGYLTEDIYTERQLFCMVIERVEPVVNYTSLLQEIDFNGETLLLTGRYETNSFAYRNVVRSRQIYAELWDRSPKIQYTGAVELLPGGGITELMTVLLSVLIALELVFSEREKGTLSLCKPTYKGGFPLILGKILAGMICGICGTTLLYGSNLLMGIVKCGTVDFSAPMQSVFGMIRSPWKMTIGGYVGLFFVVKILWTGAVMAVAYVASFRGRKMWQCCGIFLIIGALCFLRPNSVLNPYGLGSAEELFGNYWNLNVLGYPVSNLSACILTLSGILLGGFCTAVFLHMKQAPAMGERNAVKKRRMISVSGSLIGYEARKLLFMNGGTYVLALLMVLQMFVYADFPNQITPQEQLYIHYSRILAGRADAEKDNFIAQEETRFADLYQKLETYDRSFSAGEISQDSYMALIGDIYRQLDSEPVFQRARDQYALMKERKLEYVCLTAYNRLFGTEGIREILRQSIFLIFALTVGLSGVFASEYETGMIQLLHTTERERSAQKGKVVLGILYGFTGAVIVYAPQLIAVLSSYGLPGMNAPAGSVPPLGIGFGRVWSAMVIYGGIFAMISVMVSLTVLLISRITRSNLYTCVYCCALYLPPCVLGLLAV